MEIAYFVVVVTTAISTAGIAVADLIPAGFVLTNSDQVDVPRSWLPALGWTKLAGAAGLVIGLAGLRGLGIAGRRPGSVLRRCRPHAPKGRCPL
jgi:hypothetical protein